MRRRWLRSETLPTLRIRKEEVDKVVSEFGNSERIFGVGVDVSDRDQVATFVSEAVRRFGKLYGLVNSAGIRGVGNVLDTDPEVWRKVLSVNLEGTFHVPGFRLRSEQGANACRNREPQLCGRD
jgi:meso-butanediol dehydrogenase / (S,S)-butanediol dehydrogenase / diacetyl reductase